MIDAKPRKRFGLDVAERAWAAGFFDGEGSVMVRTRGRSAGARLSISQKDRRPLDRFLRFAGWGGVTGPTRSTKHTPMYAWQTSGRNAVLAVLTKMWPYLSEPKKEQARRVWAVLSKRESPRWSGRMPALPR